MIRANAEDQDIISFCARRTSDVCIIIRRAKAFLDVLPSVNDKAYCLKEEFMGTPSKTVQQCFLGLGGYFWIEMYWRSSLLCSVCIPDVALKAGFSALLPKVIVSLWYRCDCCTWARYCFNKASFLQMECIIFRKKLILHLPFNLVE